VAPKSVLTHSPRTFHVGTRTWSPKPRWRQRTGSWHDGHPSYGYAIWERIQREIDERIKLAGAQNAYFRSLSPRVTSPKKLSTSKLQPELAVVTHAGARNSPSHRRSPDLRDRDREFMAKWIQTTVTYLAAQPVATSCVGTAPRLFLRSSEFLWQEGTRPRHARGRTGLREPDSHGGLQRFPRKGARVRRSLASSRHVNVSRVRSTRSPARA